MIIAIIILIILIIATLYLYIRFMEDDHQKRIRFENKAKKSRKKWVK